MEDSQHVGWWNVLKGQGQTLLTQWATNATDQLTPLLAGRDVSWMMAWWPTLMAAQRLGKTCFELFMTTQRALRQGQLDRLRLGDPSTYEALVEGYHQLLSSVPDDVSWLQALQRLDTLYMSWLHDADARKTLMDVLSSLEHQADALLAQAVDLLMAPQNPEELRVMAQFFDRAQVFLERVIEEIVLSSVPNASASNMSFDAIRSEEE